MPPLFSVLAYTAFEEPWGSLQKLCEEIERSLLRITTMFACLGICLGSGRHALKTANYGVSQQVLQHTLNLSVMLAWCRSWLDLLPSLDWQWPE